MELSDCTSSASSIVSENTSFSLINFRNAAYCKINLFKASDVLPCLLQLSILLLNWTESLTFKIPLSATLSFLVGRYSQSRFSVMTLSWLYPFHNTVHSKIQKLRLLLFPTLLIYAMVWTHRGHLQVLTGDRYWTTVIYDSHHLDCGRIKDTRN